MVPALSAIAPTDPLGPTFGFQADTAPVAASTAPSRLRANPPSPVNPPATYNVEPSRMRAATPLLASALHARAAPAVASGAARFCLGCPPIELNVPPT